MSISKWTTIYAMFWLLFIMSLALLGSYLDNRIDNYSTSKNIQCIDGDTFAIGKTYYRLAYIDTAEKGSPTYVTSSEFTCNYLHHNKIDLTIVGNDTYDRELVVVNIDKMYSLNDLLIKECLAEPFWTITTDKILSLYNDNCKDYFNN